MRCTWTAAADSSRQPATVNGIEARFRSTGVAGVSSRAARSGAWRRKRANRGLTKPGIAATDMPPTVTGRTVDSIVEQGQNDKSCGQEARVMLRDSGELLAPAVAGSVAALTLTPADTAAGKLAPRYAAAIGAADETAATLEN